MKKNNYIAGILLIFLGLAFFLKNYNISVINTLMLLGGLYFLYSSAIKKHQPHLIFGIVLSAAGAVMLMRDLGRLRFDMSGEIFLFALGAIFLFIYFNRGIIGFVFPGYILPALAVYSAIDNNINGNYIWPSFFILLGLAFYLIYFTAFTNRSSWPLIPGTILILFGLGAFSFVLGIFSLEMIIGLSKYQNYFLAAGIVLIGIILLYKGIKK